MVKVEHLSKLFIRQDSKKKKEEFYAVDDISFEVKEGEILGVLGPNGAGKTTLLRMIGNLMKPTAGKVSILENNRVIEDSIEIKKSIGYLSENTKLYGRFTVREFLNILANIYGLSKEEAEKRIEEIRNVLDIDAFIDNIIEKLSTGQKQRVTIARCLVHSPNIYIFDEPTLGLDIIGARAILEFMIGEKKKGKSVLYSTHYMDEAEKLCDRIIMIHKGKIIAEGEPHALMEEHGTDSLRTTFFKLMGDF
ncbi:MAG: ABC transporter ATP-binding protein [Lachnospiraceae bacterium]|nr:ABC transporter ATP-binding protein [Lachnospiraceae bacterium]